MAWMADEYKRLAEMLKSIEPGLDYPNDRHSKAQVVRAALGSINVPMDEKTMLAICACGWRGTMESTHREEYDSGAGSWRKHAGRRGYHWNCPECGETVWKYYNEIN